MPQAHQQAHPDPRRYRASDRSLVVQLGRNLVMDLEDAGARAQFLIRDRDST
jgi:hypothetical protein